MTSALFTVASSFRVPGLGLLVQPAAPAPAWLLAQPLHAALQVRLHQPGPETPLLPATVEEIARDGQAPARALLLDADPDGLLPGAALELVAVVVSLLL